MAKPCRLLCPQNFPVKPPCHVPARKTAFWVNRIKWDVPPWEVQGILGHKQGGYRITEMYAKYDPDYLSKSTQAIDDYMNEILRRVKRPLVPTRLKTLRLSCVRAADKCKGPGKAKPPGFPEGFAKQNKAVANSDGFEETGGAEGNRTPDLYNAIVALSQLSYGP